MNIKISNILIVALLCASSSINAAPGIPSYSDTTLLAANKSQPLAEITTVIPSNVIFPSSLEENREQSLDYISKFSEKKRNYLLNTYKQGEKIFPKVVEILRNYDLPEEFKVLIALESGFNGNAISRAGAVGYWQLMDEVAKDYGLKIRSGNKKNNFKKKIKDDRNNFTKSTVAAARYLSDRCKNLDNNLLLIVAAYNWGLGNIKKVMKRCGKLNPTFWDIKKYLPAETRNYVMNFIALNVIFENFDKFSMNSLVFTPRTVRVINPPGTPATGASASPVTLE